MRKQELKDLTISALVLAFAFGNVYSNNLSSLPENILLALITVSISFIGHELGHRTVARKLGYYAEYKMWPQGLIMAALFSFIGFVFAAPGAVVIHQRVDLWGRTQSISKRINGLISASGPLINILLGTCFLILGYMTTLTTITTLGIIINSWLAIFNLIPFGPLDGRKVFAWDKRVWLGLLIAAGLLYLRPF